MLSKFTVKGFKNFGEKLELDLGHTCNYEFNASAVKNNLVNKGMIYGFNGCGKSNLGLAIMDIVSHVTDKQFETSEVVHYFYSKACKSYIAIKKRRLTSFCGKNFQSAEILFWNMTF